MLGAVAQANQRQRDLDSFPALAPRQRRQQQGQLDVLECAQHRHQVIELEDEADMRGAPRSEIGVGQNGDVDATDLDRAAARLVDAGDEIEKRGLARARRPHQREIIADPDVEIDVDQHADDLVAARVVLGHVAIIARCMTPSG